MRRAPLVGLPCDRKQIGHHPFQAVGEKYIRAVVDGAGCLPVLLPSLDAGRALMDSTAAGAVGAAGLTALGLALGMTLMLAIVADDLTNAIWRITPTTPAASRCCFCSSSAGRYTPSWP